MERCPGRVGMCAVAGLFTQVRLAYGAVRRGGYSVDYPGKPTAEARPVIIAGQRLPMTMQAASIDGTLFAVGVVELPADDPIWRQNAVAALRARLAGNLRGHVAARDIAVKSAAQPPVSLPAVELVAQGTVGTIRRRAG